MPPAHCLRIDTRSGASKGVERFIIAQIPPVSPHAQRHPGQAYFLSDLSSSATCCLLIFLSVAIFGI